MLAKLHSIWLIHFVLPILLALIEASGWVVLYQYVVIHFPQITILEILVWKIQPEIRKSNVSTRFNFITKWLCNKVETRKDFRFHYFWLYFVYQNFQNGYFRISLFSILFETICSKWITQHIDTKLPYQKLLLKRKERGVQNESIKSSEVLPATTSFFIFIFLPSIWTSVKELIWCLFSMLCYHVSTFNRKTLPIFSKMISFFRKFFSKL